jgi:hypothetical protein
VDRNSSEYFLMVGFGINGLNSSAVVLVSQSISKKERR